MPSGPVCSQEYVFLRKLGTPTRRQRQDWSSRLVSGLHSLALRIRTRNDNWSASSDLPAPGPNLKRATIRDVAALAGVSIGTASKALNGQGKLRADDPGPGRGRRPRAGLRPQRAGPRPARRTDLHRGRDHHGQLRPVQHPGHAGRRGRPRGRPDLGVHVRHPGRPGARAAVPGHAAVPPGGRSHRGRAADRAAAQHRPDPGHPGGVRDDPVDGQRRTRDPARRRRRRPPGRRAPAGPGPPPVRPHHRARRVSSPPGCARGASATRWPKRACPSPPTTCCTGSGARPGGGRRPGS